MGRLMDAEQRRMLMIAVIVCAATLAILWAAQLASAPAPKGEAPPMRTAYVLGPVF
jgi:hypothetical protein